MLVEPHSGRVSSGSACATCRQTAPWAGLPGTPQAAGGRRQRRAVEGSAGERPSGLRMAGRQRWRSPCLPDCLRRRDSCLSRWMDWIRRRHTATGMKAPYSMTRPGRCACAPRGHSARCREHAIDADACFPKPLQRRCRLGFLGRSSSPGPGDRDPARFTGEGRSDRRARRSRDEDGCTARFPRDPGRQRQGESR